MQIARSAGSAGVIWTLGAFGLFRFFAKHTLKRTDLTKV